MTTPCPPRRLRLNLLAAWLLAWGFCASAPCQTPASPSVSTAIRADRKVIYQGEIFNLTLSLRTVGVRLAKDIELTRLPDQSRLVCGPFRELPAQRSLQGGQIYETRRYRCEARAVAAGRIELAPRLNVVLLTRRRVSFFTATWVKTPREFQVPTLTLSVKPLPEAGRPPGFSGAVGRFAFDVNVSPTNVAVGDLVKATIDVKGDGYLEGVSPVRIAEGHHFRVYDPRPLPTEGGLAFEQILVPQSTNASAVPAISFSYFDPALSSYKTIVRGPFALTFHRRETIRERPYEGSPRTGTDAQRGFLPPAGLKESSRLPDKANAAFADSNTACRDGRVQEAIGGYTELLGQGHRRPEVYYNLGNAYLLSERGGPAILNYCRAQRLSARDRDVRKNLAYAIRRSGAEGGARSRLEAGAQALAPREWNVVMGSALLLCAVLLAARAALPRRGRAVTVAPVACLLLCALSLAASAYHRRRARTEAVATKGAPARIAPAPSALASFECREGSVVRILATSGHWARVAAGLKMGWVPLEALTLIAEPDVRRAED